MKNFIYSLLLTLFAYSAAGQQKFTGKVISATDSKPLTGVTVKLKTSKQNLQVNHDAAFSFILRTADTLEITYVGYISKKLPIDISSPKAILVRLEQQDKALEER